MSVTQPGQTQATQVGKIETAMFVNPGGLNQSLPAQSLQTTASRPAHTPAKARPDSIRLVFVPLWSTYRIFS